ncbi:MAG: hypothetical protein ACEY3D_00185 [Rickettsia sp.]|uniref:Uncharacterized protein n=1 Tax=Rickettsia peacockii (strain Rustic) TaxID=562019 RepID=C4K2Z3_RICPU|nr:hypothetical protein [Rickettsia peacockii]ACR47946.1 hypothetical protein RPR_p02 [Rickettsia peacockii str. Rustic]
MVLKKRSIVDTKKAIENLANELADKPYGTKQEKDYIVRTTISLPASVLFKLEDIARNNKRAKSKLKSVSAILRDCIKNTLNI